MFFNIKTISCKGTGYTNEDICFATSEFMWVLDGATGLGEKLIEDAETDAKWYTEKVDAYLRTYIREYTGSLVELMRDCITSVWKEFLGKIKREKIYLKDYPSASGSIVRLKGNQVEYIVFGDCPIIFKKKDGTVEEFFDMNLRNLDSQAIEKYLYISKKMGVSFHESQKRDKQILINNRKLMNTEQGYYNISFLPEAAEHAIHGTIPLKDIAAISLSTDGFAQYYTLFDLAKNADQYMEKMKLITLDDMWKELRKKQIEDYKMEKYPRFKVSDDATAIFCECQ